MVGKIYIPQDKNSNPTGLIGNVDGVKGVELIDIITQVRKQPDATSYEVHINSEGGDVTTGFDIYNFIKSLGLPVTTIGNGMVASMGTVIFMAGDTRFVRPNTKFMIHLPMGSVNFATSEEMDVVAKKVKEVENRVVQFYSKELGLNKEAISPLLKNETWLDQQQLMDLGFVTSNTPVRIAARAIKNKNKMSKQNKFRTLLKTWLGEKTVMKTIFSADNKELVFSQLGDDDPIEVGATATFDGAPAEGEITAADGTIYVFAAGVLSEIKPVMEETTTEDDMVEALAATLEVAAELEDRMAAVETEVTGLKKERDDFKEKLTKAEQTIAKLKGESKTVEVVAKDKNPKKEGVSELVAQWKKDKFKKN